MPSRCWCHFFDHELRLPIAVSLIFRGREDIKNGRFNFGVFGLISNVVALCWSLLAIPLFCMPTLESVTKESMNYASVVFAGFIGIAAIWYGVWGYNNYRGPPTDAVERDEYSPEPSAYGEVPKKAPSP
ncbi:hypothetical protein PDIDSM_1856 [Penicillium digitatum]|nr:hypothetical protein PDIDSM_1856 [Penicillium digitatum]